MLTAIYDFLFHRHKWKIIESGKNFDNTNKMQYGFYYDCQCEKCGKIKCFNT